MSVSQGPLTGKVAWVTGSSRGLGRVIATHLGQLGASIVVHGSTPTSTRAFGEGDSLASVVDEIAHLFLGEDLVRVELPPDDTEFIEVRPFPFNEVLQMVLRSEITDSMTVIAVLHAARRLGL